MEHREHNIEELRADVERQCDCYNKLWRAHNDFLMEAQTLHSQVLIRNSGGRAEGEAVGPGPRAVSLRARVIGLGN